MLLSLFFFSYHISHQRIVLTFERLKSAGMQPFDFGVVGGGIVGLAVAARLSQFGSTVLIEKHARLIEETSGRNSGVVHAGIYYPQNSLKTRLCIDGNRNLWNLHAMFPQQIMARKIGKWIGAFNESQIPKLASIRENMKALAIPVRSLSQEEILREEPRVKLCEAIESPNTGIVDVVSLASFFESTIQNASTNSLVATRSTVRRIRQCQRSKSLKIVLDQPACEPEEIPCRQLVMSAGLHTSIFWRDGGFVRMDGSLVPFDPMVQTYFCKGRYIGYRDRSIVKRLIYPCPQENLKSLGVHSIVGLDGTVRFGPDAHYVRDMDVSVSDDALFIDQMFDAIREFIPSVEREKMFVDFAGIRPKLSNEGDPFRDFHIQQLHTDMPEVTLLAGIESPGLTSCTSIADYVAERLVSPGRLRKQAAPWHQ